MESLIARKFLRQGRILRIDSLGEGLINDTFLVTTDQENLTQFVLQRINPRVFPFPERILHNLERLSDYLADQSIPDSEMLGAAQFQLPRLIPTTDHQNCHRSESGDYWRALSYIENSRTLEGLKSQAEAAQVGFALGHFHERVAGIDPASMEDSLPGFHVTPAYLAHYDSLSAARKNARRGPQSEQFRYCEEFIEARRESVPILDQAMRQGLLTVQVIHGDPKLNNILFDVQSPNAIAMVDLDTVKAGLLHHDLADCLRSCCNRSGEADAAMESKGFDLEICAAILGAYFDACGQRWSRTDINYLYHAIHILPLELGLRFLTDYLEGNRYFKVEYPEQNLIKAMGQFNLVRSIESQESEILELIRGIAGGRNVPFR